MAVTPFQGRERLRVYSAAMDREVIVDLQRPLDLPRPSGPGDKSRPRPRPGQRPTIYLLDGAEAHDTQSGWYSETQLADLAAKTDVNVVTPVGDPHSYYTDWRNREPGMGNKKFMWETFLTRELPPLLTRFGSNNVKAIAGASMGGLAALTLATRNPQLYRAVGGFSDCAHVSSPENQFLTQWDISRGGGNAMNMWGKFDDPQWRAHDPFLNAGRLAGKTVYLSAGSGMPGRYNKVAADPMDGTVKGAFLEFGSAVCTGRMTAQLRKLGIPFHGKVQVAGTHRWEYWRDELQTAWPILMKAIGARVTAPIPPAPAASLGDGSGSVGS
ncbi:alpha/beta hydrolase [Gordonia sp. (in: high G+C Gram-positive bacteria)]|uniref:alpha/beta hydrolase n=1 Tax=Gordonia sp. (in: high G+C Gram-positive bacteria) TaxID=84139 RepID=UPI0039E3175A